MMSLSFLLLADCILYETSFGMSDLTPTENHHSMKTATYRPSCARKISSMLQ